MCFAAMAPSTRLHSDSRRRLVKMKPDRTTVVVQRAPQDAPSGWTCSSSALRFRVDTAGPVSSLTMVPRSPAGGFARLARHEGGWGFPQPFCNERPVLEAVGGVDQSCVFSFVCAHWVFEVLRPRASLPR